MLLSFIIHKRKSTTYHFKTTTTIQEIITQKYILLHRTERVDVINYLFVLCLWAKNLLQCLSLSLSINGDWQTTSRVCNKWKLCFSSITQLLLMAIQRDPLTRKCGTKSVFFFYLSPLFHDHLPRWRWLDADIYRAVKWRDEYPTLLSMLK